MLMHACLTPPCLGFHPEYHCGCVAAFGLIEKRATDGGIGLGFGNVQFLAVIQAQRLVVYAENVGNDGLRRPYGGVKLDRLARGICGFMRLA